MKRRSIYHAMLWASSCLAIPSMASSAAAQETADATARTPTDSGDIVVTAQRRSESLQKTSLSVSVLSRETLDRQSVSGAGDLNRVVPSVKISIATGNAQVFIRGVGDISGNMFANPGVSLNMDGVYVARSTAFAARLYDLERVEVLKGPQGTLYGRNASGGAINLITAKPDLGSFNGRVAGEIGNYDKRYLDGMLNVPVAETLAIRLSGQFVRRDGYLSDGTMAESHESGRIRVLWAPTPDITNNLSISQSHVGGAPSARVFFPFVDPSNPWIGPLDPIITPALPGFAGLQSRVRPPNNDIDMFDVSNEFNWNFGNNMALTVLGAYQKVDALAGSQGTQSFFQDEHSEQMSLEARLSQNTDDIRWVLGAYMFNDDAHGFISSDSRAVRPGVAGRFSRYFIDRYDTRARAVFGEVNYSLLPELRVIGGLRYTTEKKVVDSRGVVEFWSGMTSITSVTDDPPAYTTRRKDNKMTWKVGAEYDIAPRSMLYGSVSTGFKASGVSGTTPEPFGPESLTAFQGGIKNQFFDRKLTLNIEGFYLKYKGQQVSFLDVSVLGTAAFVTRNIGKSTIYGSSADLIFRPTPADTLSLSLEYLHTNQDEFTFTQTSAAIFAPGTIAAPSGCISRGNPAPGRLTVDCAGKPLQRSPEFSGSGRYQHEFELSDGAAITPGVQGSFSTSYWLGILGYGVPAFKQGGYALFDADLTYETANRDLTLTAYVRNIGNRAIGNHGSLGGASYRNGIVVDLQPPRTYGIKASYKF